MALLGTVTVGATRRDLVVTIVDENDNVVDLTGGSARLQGRSLDLASKTIDAAGTITDPAQGVVTFGSIGTLVTQAELTAANAKSALFKLKVKYTDVSAEVDFTDQFELRWEQDPLQPA